MSKKEGWNKWIVLFLLMGIVMGGRTEIILASENTVEEASSALDADYSAAMLTIMGRGEVPVEEILNEKDGIKQVAIEKLFYTTEVLTVRQLPGTEYEQVGMLAKYAQVEVKAVCSNGWSAVKMENGTSGYVCSEFLSEVLPEGAKNIGESLGVFTVTYYCACPICCGSWSGGPTASGAYPTADWTIAADPSVLPLGTHVYINGHEYCVEDTGSGVNGNHIDIYVNDHERAVQNGVGSTEVFASKNQTFS